MSWKLKLSLVIQYLTELSIEKIKKERFGAGPNKEKCETKSDVDVQVDADIVQADVTPKPAASKRSRYIRVKTRRKVYERSQGRCEFVDPVTGKRCDSTSFLQNHHVTAFARGGEHSVEGLKLVCRGHNSYHAVLDFSAEWMNQFKKVADPIKSDQ